VTLHTATHDPTLMHEVCETCNALLRRAFTHIADRIMGPRDADELMAVIRETLDRLGRQR